MPSPPQAAAAPSHEHVLLRLNHASGSPLPNGITAVRATHARDGILVTVWLDDGYFARRFDVRDRVLCELRIRHWLVGALRAHCVGGSEAFADDVVARVLLRAFPPH